MELKYWNWDYKRWPLIISRVIRIVSILIRNSNSSQIFFWILFGIMNGKNSNLFLKMSIIFYLYGNLKINNPEFWNPRRLIRVLKSDWWHKSLTLDKILILVSIGTQRGPIGSRLKFEYRLVLKWIISTSFIFNPLLVKIEVIYQLISGSLYFK